jgi:hypothetical protein
VLPKSLNAPEPKPPSKSHELLRPWLELANLLSPPPLSNELERLQNVLASILRVDQWEAECHDLPAAEIVRRFERSPLAHEAAIVASLDLQELHTDEEQARSFRRLIAEIASTLRALVAAPSSKVLQQVGEMLIKRLYVNPATSRSEIWVRNGLVATSLVDPYKDFLTALAGVELARVRQCGVCSRFFFALRKDQKACSKLCNGTRRVRDWRANQAKHEYRRKLRASGILKGKRKIYRQ